MKNKLNIYNYFFKLISTQLQISSSFVSSIYESTRDALNSRDPEQFKIISRKATPLV